MTDRISMDPRICHGTPVIPGTRVPASIIVGTLSTGMKWAEIEREYGITSDDIRAALTFANRLVQREQCHPLRS